MSTLSSIMSSALSGLQTQQILIDLTSTNVANVNTDGYSRQTAEVSATSSGGVEVTDVTRETDAYTIKQLNAASEDCGELETKLQYLESIEAVFDESEGSGLSEALSDFFSAWSDLSNDASGATERSALVSEATTLANTLNEQYSDLMEIQQEIDADIASMVDDINSLTEQIADLNQKILQAGNSGVNTNTYQDERDALITELSSLVDISYLENDNGQVYIQLSNGKALVSGSTSWSLGTETDTSTGLQNVTWIDGDGNETVITQGISGGSLGGAIEVRDEVIPEYLDNLDELASEIITQVNSLHTSGYDANGDAGIDFFTGTGAADMAVNTDIVTDTDLIAASATSDGAPGDSTIAVAMAELEDSSLLNSGTSTLQEYYSSIVSKIGSLVEDTTSSYEYQSDLVEYYNNYRESVSGVSSDEELANLVLYQNAYEACAKVMSVLDELLETIISM